ncbi:hypothetical protein EON73_03825 [bacterium]|nr:MAG: hypothetical protein EON73_03825 [bacterium]
MNSNKLFKLIDLVEDIKKLDEIIAFHQTNTDSTIMLFQYQAKKVKLTSLLISELISSQFKSTSSLLFIKRLLDKFYSESYTAHLTEEEINGFKELESVL